MTNNSGTPTTLHRPRRRPAALAAALALGLLATSAPAMAAGQSPTEKRDPGARELGRSFVEHGAGRQVRDADLNLASQVVSNGTTVQRYNQTYRGIPVLGAQYVVRLKTHDGSTRVTGSNGDVFGDLDVNTTLQPSPTHARDVAARAVPGLRDGRIADRGLVVLPIGKGLLTRHVTVSGSNAKGPVRKEVYVPLGGARPAYSYDSLDYLNDGPVATTGHGFNGDALPLNLNQIGSSYFFQDRSKPMYADHGGELLTYDANGADIQEVLNPDGTVNPSVPLASTDTIPVPASKNQYGLVDAAYGAGLVYDFYKNLGRDSLDGKGGTIRSVVGVSDHGGPFPNAFWDGHAMVYGTGGFGFKPFPAELDVIGHEMTHGVVEHTADLLGGGQSGAINEAIADYFGNAIENKALGIPTSDPNSGLMGQNLCVDRSGPDCAIRDLNKLQSTRAMQGNPWDGGGVHSSSTVISGSLWEIRKALGDDLADRIVYKALSEYFTPMTDFLAARTYVLQAAQALGVTPAQLAVVQQAFDHHGVVAGWENGLFDSKALKTGLVLADPASVGGGRYAVNDVAGENGSKILVGPVDGHRAPSTAASDSMGWLATPAIDGKRVAWSRTGNTNGQAVNEVRTRVLGGRTRTVARYSWDSTISDVAIDGRTIAWTVLRNGTERSFVRLPNGKTVRLWAPKRGSAAQVSVRGNEVVYVATSKSGKDQVRVYSTRTRHSHRVAVGKHLTSPVLTRKYVVFLRGGNLDGPDLLGADVVRVNRNGSHGKVLVRGRSALAPAASLVSANDRWVAFESISRNLSYVVPLRGGRTGRVSCSQGAQINPAVTETGNRVVFLDASASRNDLRTRVKPAGRC